MASPRNAGLKDVVNSLKLRKFWPSSMFDTLLTIFSKATLAHALLHVLRDRKDSYATKILETHLICEPNIVWTALFLLIRVLF